MQLEVGQEIERDKLLRKFVDMQYTRNDLAFTRGTFRVRGDTIEVFPVYEELAVRIEMFGDEIEAISTLHPLTGEVISNDETIFVFPATHYVAGPERMERAIAGIETELEERLAELDKQGKLLEAQRLRMRTTYDIEMMRQVGFCSGIENYSRHIDGRGPGTPPHTLLDYFPDDFLLVIDESHVTVPQIGGMYEGDMSRKRTLVDHGFRLPSAMDNRPLKWEEFLERIGQTVYLSATPGPYELSRVEERRRRAGHPADRPDRPGDRGQADQGSDRRPLHEIKTRAEQERARPGHDADQEDGRGPHRLPARARHPGALPAQRGRHAAPRRAAARAADGRVRRPRRHQPAARGSRPARGVAGQHPRRRQGGLPPLGHVADPDHRPRRAQRVRRGAHVRRHDHAVDAEGDRRDQPPPRRSRSPTTPSSGIDPQPLRKRIADILDDIVREDEDTSSIGGSGRAQSRGKTPVPGMALEVEDRPGSTRPSWPACPRPSWRLLIQQLQDQMHAAAAELQFELAARLRDEVNELKKELRGMDAAGAS